LGSAAENAVRTLASKNPFTLLVEILSSWRFAWLYTLVGLCLFPPPLFERIGLAFLALTFGALVGALVATDVGRMFSVLSPVVGISSAQFFGKLLAQRSYICFFLLIACMLFGSVTTFPNVFLNEELLNGARSLKIIMALGNSLVFIVGSLLLRRDLLAASRENIELLRNILRRRDAK
jgi:hypothetical protein